MPVSGYAGTITPLHQDARLHLLDFRRSDDHLSQIQQLRHHVVAGCRGRSDAHEVYALITFSACAYAAAACTAWRPSLVARPLSRSLYPSGLPVRLQASPCLHRNPVFVLGVERQIRDSRTLARRCKSLGGSEAITAARRWDDRRAAAFVWSLHHISGTTPYRQELHRLSSRKDAAMPAVCGTSQQRFYCLRAPSPPVSLRPSPVPMACQPGPTMRNPTAGPRTCGVPCQRDGIARISLEAAISCRILPHQLRPDRHRRASAPSSRRAVLKPRTRATILTNHCHALFSVDPAGAGTPFSASWNFEFVKASATNSSRFAHSVLAIHLARLLHMLEQRPHPARPPAQLALIALHRGRMHSAHARMMPPGPRGQWKAPPYRCASCSGRVLLCPRGIA